MNYLINVLPYLTSINNNKNMYDISYSKNQRLKYANDMLEKHPNRVPIIVKFYDNIKYHLNNPYFMCKKNITISEFLLIIRKRLKINKNVAIFLFLDNNILPSISNRIEEIYNKHHDPDTNDLVVYITLENCFGSLM
tara:strand:- start:188 stop:598 length:411 start_codon:yes stop_codon:yes gene_type:complete